MVIVFNHAPGQICPLRDDRVMHVAHRAAADPSASQRSDHLKKPVDEMVIDYRHSCQLI